MGFPVAQQERIHLQHRSCRRHEFSPWVEKIPWRSVWQPTPVFSPGKIPSTEESGSLQSVVSQWVGHDWNNSEAATASLFYINLNWIQRKLLGSKTHIYYKKRKLLYRPDLLKLFCWCDPLVSSVQSLSRVWHFANPMNLPGSSANGIAQARILEWVAISFSKGSSWPRDRTHVPCGSCIGRQIFLTTEPLGKRYLHSMVLVTIMLQKLHCLQSFCLYSA